MHFLSGGRGAVTPYEAAALKDVVYLETNEAVEVLANYAPWAGVYMFHCHNLVHEDHDMMAAFNVTDIDLTALGYGDAVSFVDPLTEQFAAKPLPSGDDIASIQANVLPAFAALDVYPKISDVNTALGAALAEQAVRRKEPQDKVWAPRPLERIPRAAMPTAAA